MKNFSNLGVSEQLNKTLLKIGFTTPTPIQEKSIPLILEGKDILGSAQTGTGKTGAFTIPLVEIITNSEHRSALILTPTRELAKQVLNVVHQLLGYKSPIKTAFIIGGESMGKQFSQLKQNPRIIVGTPGRINDHLERGSLKLNNTKFLVLDETDRMLDMGFGIQLDVILKYLPKKRQTLMFSATLPKNIVNLANKYLKNHERVAISVKNIIADNIQQDVLRIKQNEKYNTLCTQLQERDGSIIIFVKTKIDADKMAKSLKNDGFKIAALHGGLKQNQRDKVMQNFRKERFEILVATDVASRGLDIPHIRHVINYDVPQNPEDYIHRMGRTARAGAKGSALCFVSPQDGRKWAAIERMLNPDAKKEEQKNKNTKNRKPRRRFSNKNTKPGGKANNRNFKNKAKKRVA